LCRYGHIAGGADKQEEKLAPWQKWINYESPFKSQTDELNRKRHYFWRVDSKGRMLRRELHVPNETFGELKAPKARDLLLAVVKRNTTGQYIEPENGSETSSTTNNCFPFLAMRLHEHNFMQCEELSPIVYHDLVDSSDQSICSRVDNSLFKLGVDYFLRFGSELKLPFHPDQLFVSKDGKLYHSYKRSEVINPHIPKSVAQHSKEDESVEEDTILGLLDATVAQKLLSSIESKVCTHSFLYVSKHSTTYSLSAILKLIDSISRWWVVTVS